MPLAFGGWTVAANITFIFAAAMAFMAWYVGRSLFYTKHERVIVAWELEGLTASVEARKQFLATGKWPGPDQVKQLESDARDLAFLEKCANMDPDEEMRKIITKPDEE